VWCKRRNPWQEGMEKWNLQVEGMENTSPKVGAVKSPLTKERFGEVRKHSTPTPKPYFVWDLYKKHEKKYIGLKQGLKLKFAFNPRFQHFVYSYIIKFHYFADIV
jgi:hypothetical protein